MKYKDMSQMGPLHSAQTEVKQDINMSRQLEQYCNGHLYLISKMDLKYLEAAVIVSILEGLLCARHLQQVLRHYCSSPCDAGIAVLMLLSKTSATDRGRIHPRSDAQAFA